MFGVFVASGFKINVFVDDASLDESSAQEARCFIDMNMLAEVTRRLETRCFVVDDAANVGTIIVKAQATRNTSKTSATTRSRSPVDSSM